MTNKYEEKKIEFLTKKELNRIRWKQKIGDLKNDSSDCSAEECAKRVKEEKGLPNGALIAIGIVCPCKRCNKRILC